MTHPHVDAKSYHPLKEAAYDERYVSSRLSIKHYNA